MSSDILSHSKLLYIFLSSPEPDGEGNLWNFYIKIRNWNNFQCSELGELEEERAENENFLQENLMKKEKRLENDSPLHHSRLITNVSLLSTPTTHCSSPFSRSERPNSDLLVFREFEMRRASLVGWRLESLSLDSICVPKSNWKS